MKYILILFLLFTYPSYAQTYTTSFGAIENGYTQRQVVDILGNPHHVSSHNKTDIWYYLFDEDGRLFVYFIDGKVIEVRNKEDLRT